MKKIYFGLLLASILLVATPALAASKLITAKTPTVWKPLTPDGYSPINWVKAPGITSFFKAPEDSGATDYLTRIYLPQNQIDFIISTSSPVNLNSLNSDFGSSPVISVQPASLLATSSGDTLNDISNFDNLSFQRLGAEVAKIVSPAIKFIWDAPFFNMKPSLTDLSLAVKYSVGTTTTITSGSRSVPDMSESRRMLIIDNQNGKASIQDFDSNIFTDNKNGDQALEGFAPTVAKTDGASNGASRLFLGVSDDNRELVIYCSQLATVNEASAALNAAGISPDHQLEADGGGSAACAYNLPGQFFVEPTRTLPLLMGAETILARGSVTAKTMNVRSGPATKYSVVGQLVKGVAIRAYEEKNGWYRIGAGQWVLKSLISCSRY